MRQSVLKAAGAALFHAGKRDVYYSKIKPLIEEAASFEKSFYAACRRCGGKGTSEANCPECGGSGRCKYSGCRNGLHRSISFRGESWDYCKRCRGTGECQKCRASGKRKTKCFYCKNGFALNRDAAAEVYRDSVKEISKLAETDAK